MTAPTPPARLTPVHLPLAGAALGWNAAIGDLDGWRWAGALGAGFALWTVLEYTVHRFALHGGAASPFRSAVQRHVRHHEDHAEPEFMLIAPGFTLPLTAAVWAAVSLALGSWREAALVTAGTLLGYVAYEGIHGRLHDGRPGGGLVRRWRRRHFRHHFGDPGTCFGVTTSLWDHVFGTAGRSRRRETKSRRTASGAAKS